MANPPPGYLRVLFEHYDHWSRELSERWSKNAQNAANGTLDPKKLLTDTLYLTNEGIKGLWAPLLVGKYGYPGVVVILAQGGPPQTGSIPFAGDSTKVLSVSQLKKVGGVKVIPTGDINVAFGAGNTTLDATVSLATVNEAAGETYEGTIMLDGDIVAILRAEITP